MSQRKQPSRGLYMIGIAVLFLAGFLLLVIFGAQSYRGAVTGQSSNMRARALLAYFYTVVRDNDTKDAVTIDNSTYGPVLVIADGDSGYALRLYRFETENGSELMEDFAAIDDELMPESAQTIGQTDIFEVEKLEDGLLAVRTDAGRVLLHVRSEGDAA